MVNDNPQPDKSPFPESCTRGKRDAISASSSPLCRGACRLAVFFLMLATLVNVCAAAETIRLAVQKTGTFAWELSVLKERGLDHQNEFSLEITEYASPEAAKIALLGGTADLILTDWLWVARQRSLGPPLRFVPYSTAVGTVLVKPGSPIWDLADLKGKTIAVAGGPLDKSWLLLQAFAREKHVDIAAEAKVVYGAPPLLYQKALAGEVDAILNYWNFSVALEAQGFRPLLTLQTIEKHLGAKGPVAMVGYVFRDDFAQTHAEALNGFLKAVAKAKDILKQSGGDWEKIASQGGIEGKVGLALYQKSYAEGIPHRPIEEEAADAQILYSALAKAGGEALTGPAKELDEEIYFKGAAGFVPPAN